MKLHKILKNYFTLDNNVVQESMSLGINYIKLDVKFNHFLLSGVTWTIIPHSHLPEVTQLFYKYPVKECAGVTREYFISVNLHINLNWPFYVQKYFKRMMANCFL